MLGLVKRKPPSSIGRIPWDGRNTAEIRVWYGYSRRVSWIAHGAYFCSRRHAVADFWSQIEINEAVTTRHPLVACIYRICLYCESTTASTNTLHAFLPREHRSQVLTRKLPPAGRVLQIRSDFMICDPRDTIPNSATLLLPDSIRALFTPSVHYCRTIVVILTMPIPSFQLAWSVSAFELGTPNACQRSLKRSWTRPHLLRFSFRFLAPSRCQQNSM